MPGFLPEPKYQHGALARAAILLVNLGTPDAPIPEAVSVRPARDRDSPCALAARPARVRPQREAEGFGAEVRPHLVQGRLAPEGAHRAAGAPAARLLRAGGPLAVCGRFRHALRRALDTRRARAT